MKILTLFFAVFFFMVGCQKKQSDREFENRFNYIDVSSYILLKEYYSSLMESFESESDEKSINELNEYFRNLETKIKKKCFDKQCVDNISEKGIIEIKKYYYNFDLILNNEIIPVNSDVKCFQGKAILFIDVVENTIKAFDSCNNSQIVFNIIGGVKYPKEAAPDEIFLQINGDANGDSEVDQTFTFKIAGRYKWYVVTEGRSVYSFGTSDVSEIALENVYTVK